MSTGKRFGCIMRQSGVTAYISLGSNQGNPADNLQRAVSALERLAAETPGARLAAVSPVYLTEPQGAVRDQPFFANQAATLDCDNALEPEALLARLQAIEALLGRDRLRETPGGPRPLDLDLLLYGDCRRDAPDLTLPHPRLTERAFVLLPLADIAPGLFLSGGLTVEQALDRLDWRRDGHRIYQNGDRDVPPTEAAPFPCI